MPSNYYEVFGLAIFVGIVVTSMFNGHFGSFVEGRLVFISMGSDWRQRKALRWQRKLVRFHLTKQSLCRPPHVGLPVAVAFAACLKH